jgi:hypothetical protein
VPITTEQASKPSTIVKPPTPTNTTQPARGISSTISANLQDPIFADKRARPTPIQHTSIPTSSAPATTSATTVPTAAAAAAVPASTGHNSFLSDDKLKSVLSYLDQIEQNSQDAISDITAKAKRHALPLTGALARPSKPTDPTATMNMITNNSTNATDPAATRPAASFGGVASTDVLQVCVNEKFLNACSMLAMCSRPYE